MGEEQAEVDRQQHPLEFDGNFRVAENSKRLSSSSSLYFLYERTFLMNTKNRSYSHHQLLAINGRSQLQKFETLNA